MKKITFILLALLTGTAFGQTKTDDATAVGKAQIVKPIGISNVGSSVLDFGKLIPPTAGSATATLAAEAAPTIVVTSDMLTLTSTTSTAEFSITGSATEAYSITVTNTDLSLSGETALAMTTTKSLTNATYTGNQTLFVGGEITVPNGQGEGAYAGDITVTVTYQ